MKHAALCLVLDTNQLPLCRNRAHSKDFSSSSDHKGTRKQLVYFFESFFDSCTVGHPSLKSDFE